MLLSKGSGDSCPRSCRQVAATHKGLSALSRPWELLCGSYLEVLCDLDVFFCFKQDDFCCFVVC